MLDYESLKLLQILLRELDVPPKQCVDGVWAERKRCYALVQLADGDGGVVSHLCNLFDCLSVATGNPTDTNAGERVGLTQGTGGDGVGISWNYF